MMLKRIAGFFFIILFISACNRNPSNLVQGYIEGRYTYIATSVAGVLKEIFVVRGDSVRSGQLLFKLEDQPESDIYRSVQQDLQQTIATRDAILPNLKYAKLTMDRYQILVPKHAIDQSQLDNAKATYLSTLAQVSSANANIASLQAKLAQSKWTLDQKHIVSPVDGIVFDTFFRVGEYVDARQAVLSVLAPGNIKVIFYVKEKYLGQIKLGDMVNVNCDGCKPNVKAKISFISPSAEYTPPVIFSNDTTEKLIYRIEAEFNLQAAQHMHPGQPVTVAINIHG